jgi:hypothetical protein
MFLKSVVLIEKAVTNEPLGTGFIYAQHLSDNDDGTCRANLFLVTAKHVLYDDKLTLSQQLQEIDVRFDVIGHSSKRFRIGLYLDGMAIFTPSPSGEDVAVISLVGDEMAAQGIEYTPIIDKEHALTSSKYDEAGLAVGDAVFFLGFPLGLRGRERNYPLCRTGIVSRLDVETLSENHIYLDAPVFPGNSGGPVFTKPEAISIQGTQSLVKSYFIGLAVSYMSSAKKDEVAKLTESQLIQLLENHLGLSKIITVDAIEKTILESMRVRGFRNE